MSGFEEKLQAVEEIIRSIEEGTMPLEDAVAAYKQGADLLVSAKGILDAKQQEIYVIQEGLKRVFEEDTDDVLSSVDAVTYDTTK